MTLARKLPQKISEMSFVHYFILNRLGVPTESKEFVTVEEKFSFEELKKMGLITKYEGSYPIIPTYIRTPKGDRTLETIEENKSLALKSMKNK